MPGLDKQTKLLLHFNGPDAAHQIQDKANVPVLYTRNSTVNLLGDYTGQRRFGKNAFYFNGGATRDYLVTDNASGSADWAFGTGAFTVELWFRVKSAWTNGWGLIGKYTTGGSGKWGLQISTAPAFYWYYSSGAAYTFALEATPRPDVWYHVAICRDGSGNLRCFFNGEQRGSTTADSTNYSDTSLPVVLGEYRNENYDQNFNGEIDEVRIIKGSALYTTDFQVPDEPLTAVTNTVGLWHLEDLMDESGNDHELTPKSISGWASYHTGERRFGEGAFDFDGTDDFLAWVDHADWQLGGGTGNFTIDFWIKPDDSLVSSKQTLFEQQTDSTHYYSLSTNNSGYLNFRVVDGSTIVDLVSSAAYAWVTGVWYHIAVIRGWSGNANDWALCVNGAVIGTLTDDSTIPNLTGPFRIGAGRHGADVSVYYYDGKIDEFRISNTARWTAAFDPPTTEHTPDANTKLLAHGEFNGKDSSSTDHAVDSTTIGVVCTAVSKFGLSSAVFNGTSDYISAVANHIYNIHQYTDYTVDFWAKRDNNSGTHAFFAMEDGSLNNGWWIYATSAGKIGAQGISGAAELWLAESAANVWQDSLWHHVALVKKGSDIGLYLDGKQVAYDSYSGSVIFDYAIALGARTGGGGSRLDGNMDEFRIEGRNSFSATPVVGLTDTLTVPTEAHTESDYTLTLLHLDSEDVSVDGDKDTQISHIMDFVTSGGSTPTIDTGAIRRFGRGCLKLDGTDDYVRIADHADWNFGDGNFTIDFWIRPTSDWNSFDKVLFDIGPDANSRIILSTYNGTLHFYAYNNPTVLVDISTASQNWSPDLWYHIAVVRGWSGNANDYAICVNGVAIGTGTDSTTMPDFGGYFHIGYGWDYGAGTLRYQDGYYDEFRVSKGIARWTANFTPPSAAYTSDANTSLLLHFENMFDSGNTNHTANIGFMNGAELNGESVLGRGAINCGIAGYSPYFYYADHANWDFSTSQDFCIDFWIKFQSVANACVLGNGTSGGWCVRYNLTNTRWEIYMNGSVQESGTHTPLVNLWYHIAVQRSSDNLRIFVNGVYLDTGTTYSTAQTSVNELFVCRDHDTAEYVRGWLDDVRITKGATRFTHSGFTPPTTEPTNDADTVLLLPCNINFNDEDKLASQTPDHTPTMGNSNPYPFITAPCRFGTGGVQFVRAGADSGDWLVTKEKWSPDFDIFNSNKGEFTVDFWFKHTLPEAPHSGYEIYLEYGSHETSYFWYFTRAEDDNHLAFQAYYGGTVVYNTSAAWPFRDAAWHHMAICKVGTLYGIYVDGIQKLYITDTAGWCVTDGSYQYMHIGAGPIHWRHVFGGWMDEVRFQKGNYFSSAPVVGLTDTIDVPTEEYGPTAELLEVDVYDSITISEYQRGRLDPLSVIKYDDIGIEDAEQQEMPELYRLSYDDISIDEFVAAKLPVLNVSVYDYVSIVDISDPRIPILLQASSDDISITEFDDEKLPSLFINVFDTITISEFNERELKIYVNVYDDISIAEDDSELLPILYASTNDMITIAEDDIEFIPRLDIVMSDDISIDDFQSETMPVLYRLVFETITVDGDHIHVHIPGYFMYGHDHIAIAEYVRARINVLYVNVYDEISVTDTNDELIPTLLVSEFDDITIAEDDTELIPTLLASVYDDITIAEDLEFELHIFVNVFDDIAIAEYFNGLIPILYLDIYDDIAVSDEEEEVITVLYVSVFDDISINEYEKPLIPILYVSEIETITISEYQRAYLADLFRLVFDTVTISDFVSVFMPTLVVGAFDTINISEDDAELLPGLVLSSFDNITISENVDLTLMLNVSVFDDISVTDEEQEAMVLVIHAFDNIVISEYIRGVIGILSVATYDVVHCETSDNVHVVVNELLVNVYDEIFIMDEEQEYRITLFNLNFVNLT